MTKRTLLFILVGVLLASRLSAGDDRASDARKKDLDGLQGTWELISAEKDGKDVTKECKDRGFTVTFRDDKWLQDIDGRPFDTAANSRITLDPLKSPKEFDHIVSSRLPGDITTFRYPGIYELDRDSLKICFGVEIKSRPTQFATKANDGHLLAILKRVKGKEKQ